jgi:ABC-type spermidine/putrescine transport system permease subunit II
MIKTSRNMPVINALSTLLLVATFAVVALSFWLTRRGELEKTR